MEEDKKDNTEEQLEQIIKIITNYYHWEKEKEKLFFNKDKNMNKDCILEQKKTFYLIDKNWVNTFKTNINYDKLLDQIEEMLKDESEINIEEIIKKKFPEVCNKPINELITELKCYNNNLEEKLILANLLEKKIFDLEIINEQLKNSLIYYYEGIKLEIICVYYEDIILFKMLIDGQDIILLISPLEEENSYIYKLFFIFDDDTKITEEFLEKKISKKSYKDILKDFNINLQDIIDKDGKIEREINVDDITYKIFIIVSKIANNYNIPFYNNNNSNKNTTNIINNDYIIEKKKDYIQAFFYSLDMSNTLYRNALTEGDINSNYSPCKIIGKKWMEDFIELFKYKDKNKIVCNSNQNDKFKELIRNFQKINKDNIEKGDFYIISEFCFLALFPLIYKLEELQEKYLDYKIYLNKGNKGAIIIDEDIYIFETKNDINIRIFYQKVKSSKKFEFLYKTATKPKFELTEEIWNTLKININEEKENNNNNNKLDEKKNTPIINEEINNFLDTLLKRENEMKIFEQKLIKRENEMKIFEQKLIEREIYLEKRLKEINDNRTIILDKKKPTIGLQNLGATCYMNAPLQCMAHFHEVSEKILTWYKYSNDNDKKSKVLSFAYAELLDNIYFPKVIHNNNNNNNNYIYNYTSKYYAPNNFKQVVGNLNRQFQGIQANDSKDIMNYIIEKMHSELNPLGENKANNNNQNYNNNIILDQTNELLILTNFQNEFKNNYHSILSEYLYGLQKTVTLCNNCGTMIFNFQTYNFLIFPLLEVKKYIVFNNCQNPFFQIQNYTITLIDCFKYYQKIDFFTGPNQIFCNKCQCLQNANYCTMLYNVPTILCIVLNRGKDNLDFQEGFNFPIKLDLSDFIQDKNDCGLYYLIGLVVHVGDSSMSGHFFAYCRSHFTSPWYKYNDAIVTKCNNENEIYSIGKPYILFYHKYQ